MDSLHNQKTISADSVFSQRFLNSKSLYLYCFSALPSIHYVGDINGEKAYGAFKERFAELIRSEHQIRCYDKKRKHYEFDQTVIILNNHCIVQFDEGWSEILHDGTTETFLLQFTRLCNEFKTRARKKPLEINLIVQGSYGLDLRSMEIKPTKLDLDLYYEDEFKQVDAVIHERIHVVTGIPVAAQPGVHLGQFLHLDGLVAPLGQLLVQRL